jgi:hypothetical protein
MNSHIEEELEHLHLGDLRRGRRFAKLLNQLVNNPASSITDRQYDWADVKGAYRFFSNENIKAPAIADAINKATLQRCLQNDTILCIQDTTNISFESSPAEGLGYLDRGYSTGLMSHNILAVDVKGIVLGILDQNIWARDIAQMGKTKRRNQRPISEKESNRWIEGLQHCERLLADCKKIITIADREADIYDLFARRRAINSELLIRATRDRKTLLGNSMWKEVEQSKQIARFELEIGNPLTGELRMGQMIIRTAMVLLAPPVNKASLPAICVHGLIIIEENAPKDHKPLEWRLISSMPVESPEMAMQLAQWYTYRWRIERFHYILKSGCKLEDLQLRTIDALKKAVLMYSLCAFKLMQLLYESRLNPEQPCTNFITREESEVIYIYNNKVKLVQKQPLTLSKAVWYIARMGGYPGRNNDGPPGIKTLWKGLQKVHTLMQIYGHNLPGYPQNSFG